MEFSPQMPIKSKSSSQEYFYGDDFEKRVDWKLLWNNQPTGAPFDAAEQYQRMMGSKGKKEPQGLGAGRARYGCPWHMGGSSFLPPKRGWLPFGFPSKPTKRGPQKKTHPFAGEGTRKPCSLLQCFHACLLEYACFTCNFVGQRRSSWSPLRSAKAARIILFSFVCHCHKSPTSSRWVAGTFNFLVPRINLVQVPQ